MSYFVYLLASRRYGTLYLGVTHDFARRVHEHKPSFAPALPRRYGVDTLVWSETYDQIDEAIAREKALKKWRPRWKVDLIEAANPDWRDVYEDIIR